MKGEPKIIILDAMGVIYSAKDDVQELLIPFVAEKGGIKDTSKIKEFYRSASLGQMPAREFWRKVEVGPELEDEYLLRHTLTGGLFDFLAEVRQQGHRVFCLSNDVSEWSKKLRTRFELNKFIADFIISGDVGLRKPDPAIFYRLIEGLQIDPRDSFFVDDNRKNLDSAAAIGFETVLFRPDILDPADNSHKMAVNFDQLKLFL
jgi:HAD superfamily hydrolase (TIGR01549 family)